MNSIGIKVSIASGFRDKFCWELECVGRVGHNGIRDGFVKITRETHGDCLLSGFTILQRVEAKLKKLKSETLLRSEERYKIV